MTKIVLLSAGFKYGHPRANHLFDVTSVPNPVRSGQPRHGYTSWLSQQPAVWERIKAIVAYISAVGEQEPGVFALCCTGGQHRSVFMAEEVARRLQELHPTWIIEVQHQDAWVE